VGSRLRKVPWEEVFTQALSTHRKKSKSRDRNRGSGRGHRFVRVRFPDQHQEPFLIHYMDGGEVGNRGLADRNMGKRRFPASPCIVED